MQASASAPGALGAVRRTARAAAPAGRDGGVHRRAAFALSRRLANRGGPKAVER